MAASVSMCARQAMKIPRLAHSLVFNNTSSCSRLRMTTTATNGKTNETPADEKTASQAKSDAEKEEVKEEIPAAQKELAVENEKLLAQIAEMKDKYMRSLAETENVRQRMKKQIEESKIFGIQTFCKDLLEVADVLGKATESVPREEIQGNTHLKNLYEGLTMTESQLQKVFLKHGLHQIVPTEGEKFDPFLHEALFQVPTTDEKNTGIAVLQKSGYRLHDRTIRPALVGVFKSS